MSFYLFNAKTSFAQLCLTNFGGLLLFLAIGMPACATPVQEGTAQPWLQQYQPNTLPNEVPDAVPNAVPNPAPNAAPQDMQLVMMLRWAIIGQESGANFRAVNPHSGALGYAQVMPANLPQWSKQALGYAVTRAQFLSRPDLQIAIVDYKLNQYWKKSLIASQGNEALAVMRVAAWWYSGKPERYRSTRPEFYRGHRYPSIAAYSRSVLKRYLALVGDSEDAALPPPSTPLGWGT
jgi:hypothetical protein